ncbi:mechanosensitive ion channel family protein [Mangrovivirga cuniculi]|uniref:Mechanosensitive ion channel protein MscS n=1 Tax=Mangrovivirga cuniculi TaxID=2715131 RepID=A0A4D7JGY7_9BACT|nr:mechanosensitive ion channel family protein [Mangrovivirga cuniculi]QCK14861.1 mechanosensitive ion channel protein MscS [Mangrovivirga cuniculi]
MFEKIRNSFNEQISIYYEELVEIIPKLTVAIILFLVFYFVARGIKRIIGPRLQKRIQDFVMAKFITDIIFYTIFLIGILVFLRVMGYGNVIIGIFSGAGVVAIVFGFAFKDIGENFIAGLIMAFNRPFKHGDLIQIGDQKGRVQEMSLRLTRIKTYDGKDVYIPNARIIKDNLINYTVDGYLRYEIPLGIDYGSNLGKVAEIILKTLEEVDGVLKEPKPTVYLTEYGSNTANLVYTIWVDLFDTKHRRFDIKTDAMRRVWNALDESGFNMPGNILELKNYDSQPFELKTASTDK